MRSLLSPFALALALSTTPLAAHEEINVVTSIKPIHSLVAGVMAGVGEPTLLVEGAGSPHTYALKPSQARTLQNADLVFWVGPYMETFLPKSLDSLAASAHKIELMQAPGLIEHAFREGGAFEGHDHGDHDEHDHEGHDHDEHAHEKHDDHDHEEHAHSDHDEHKHDDHGHDHEKHDEHAHEDHDHEGHDHEEHHDEHAHDDHHDDEEHAHDEHAHNDEDPHAGHDHGAVDAHIWLDPQNAIAMLAVIEEELIEHDPEHADEYTANAAAMREKLTNMEAELAAKLKDLQGKPYIVFHDAYQYFENRFGLTPAGSITISPEVQPGAKRISEIQGKIKDTGALCVFAEPQFRSSHVDLVMSGTGAKAGVLDPLGSELEDGADLYENLIRGMANSLKDCLAS